MDYSKFPVFSDSIEQGALDQFYSACSLSFTTRAALMPDAHLGYSLPIGAVVETAGMIMPSWVGYDIGCGVSAYKTIKQLVWAERTKHSKKPQEVRDRIEKLLGARTRIELFAREKAEGWDVWGNEVTDE